MLVVTRKIVVSSIAFFVLVAAIAVAIVVGIRAVQLFLRHLLHVVRFSKILLLAVI